MKKLYFLPAAALTALLCGCSSDDPLQEDTGKSNPSEEGSTYYISVVISGDTSGSRAVLDDGSPLESDDFDQSATENKVNNAYFAFYDNTGTVVGGLIPVTLDVDDIPNGTTDNTTIEHTFTGVVPISIPKGVNIADVTGAICYLNPISSASLMNPLATIQTVERDAVKYSSGENDYFAMSNSVYYPDNAATEPTITAAVTKECFKETMAEASAKTNNDKVTIYVERYASKLAFNATNATNTPYETKTRVYATNAASSRDYTQNDVKLEFVPSRWALNAESNSTFVIKSLRKESTAGEILPENYSYNDLNSAIESYKTGLDAKAWAWNNPAYHRCYWGMSPAYFTATYPEVSGDVTTEADGKQYANINGNKTVLHQKYYTYNELTAETDPQGFVPTNATAQYFRETTVGSKSLASANPAASTPSVIFVGSYKVTCNGTEVSFGENDGFYTYLTWSEGAADAKALVYFEDDGTGKSKVSGGGSMLTRFLVQQTVLYKKVGDEYVNMTVSADFDKLLASLEVAEPAQVVVDQVPTTKLQPNARSLQLKAKVAKTDASGNTTYVDNTTANTGIYVTQGGKFMQIVANDATIAEGEAKVTINQANAQLMQQVGFAYYYLLGEGYYNIPVRHYGFYRSGNENKNADKINWNTVRVGDFGMVRNHSYQIQVDKIEGLASGIGGNDDPIVPPATTVDYYVAYRVNILKWAIVPTQTVNL